MKKILIACLVLVSIFCLCSCTAGGRKEWSQMFSYKDPQSIGGLWNITMQTGEHFDNVKCTYWGTDDDTSVWETIDGTIIIQSGAVTGVKAK